MPYQHAGEVSVFTKYAGIISSISLGRTGMERFVSHTSGGETELPSYTWPDREVSNYLCIY